MSGLLFMKSSLKKQVFVMHSLIALAIIFFAIVCLWPLHLLEVRVDGTEELVHRQPAKIGETFDVVWTHSVTLQPVTETYKLEAPGRITLVRMVFSDFGPNLPARPEFNQQWTFSGGYYVVTNYDLCFERVPVVIGAVIADHTLRFSGKEIRLKDAFRPGGYVHIGLVKKRLSKYLLEEAETWLKNRSGNLR